MQSNTYESNPTQYRLCGLVQGKCTAIGEQTEDLPSSCTELKYVTVATMVLDATMEDMTDAFLEDVKQKSAETFDRTPEQVSRFRAGLSSIHVFYVLGQRPSNHRRGAEAVAS